MTAIIKNNFRLQNARDFLENFESGQHTQTRNHYLFIGKPTVWGTGSQNEELSPTSPQDTKYEEQRVWDEMLGLKKIEEAYTSLVVPRSDWDATGNTKYAVYDDKDPDLYKQPTAARSTAASVSGNFAGNFYVMTDEFDIFICLNNGNNSVSTVKPIRPNPATNLVDYSGSDGYVWKYVGSVKQSDVIKFVTDSWIPVKTLAADDDSFQWDVQAAAVAGQVVSVQVDSPGSGYTRTYTGGFTGTLTNVGGKGLGVLSGSPSSTTDFYNNGQIHITSGPDSGSIYTIESYNGATKQVTLTGPWAESGGSVIANNTSQCSILPRLDVVTNGTAVKFRPVISSGQFTRVIILSAGSDASFVSITVQNSLGGTGAVVRPVLADPYRGLGADIEKDLSASFVMLNARLTYTEGLGDFPINNDYRQIGIIRDVKNYAGTLATSATLIATKKLQLQSITGTALTFDEIVQTGVNGVKGIVLDYTASATPGEGTITFIQNPTTGYGTFTAGQNIQGTASGTPFSATIKSGGVINEEVKKRVGEILYLENRRAVLRAPDQLEDIKAIIEF